MSEKPIKLIIEKNQPITHGIERVVNLGDYESVRYMGHGTTAKRALKAMDEMEELLNPEAAKQRNNESKGGSSGGNKKDDF